MAEPCSLPQQLVQTGSVPSVGLCCFPGEKPSFTSQLAALPWAWSCQDPPTATAATGRERRRLSSFRLVGDPQGHKATEASHPHTVQAATGMCWWWGHGSVLPPGVTSKPCPCWGSHQPGLATSKDLQPPACAAGRIWDPAWGAQVPGWPRPPACPGHVEGRWQCQLGQRGGDTDRDKTSKERMQQGQWAALCPTQAVLAQGAPAAPSHGRALSGGSPRRL